MLRKSRFFHSVLLGTALLAPLIIVGCSARVSYRVYDPYYTDYHYWGPGEDVYYRRWLGERHYEYRDFRRLDPDRRKDYWQWRHSQH